jgi:regulator of sigma E protease
VTGKVGLNGISGPVGIVSQISGVISQDLNAGVPPELAISAREAFLVKLFELLQFSAAIGVNLGLINLVPFPALDGSKLLLIVVEAIRRKPLAPEREAVISLVGLAALMAIMVLTLFNDIGRLVAK